MKILHFCIANYYVEGYNYQENALARQNVIDNHEVMIIASTKTLKNGTEVHYEKTNDYVNPDGIQVRRVPFSRMPFSKKINKLIRFEDQLEDFGPDIIFFHGVNSVDLKRVIKYIKNKNKKVVLFIDNHTWFGQAGYKSKIGKRLRVLFHKFFFKPILSRNLEYIEKLFSISIECQYFMEKVYDIPSSHSKSELFPLGGNIVEKDKKQLIRKKNRDKLSITDDTIVYLHTGRLTKYKKTIELLRQFNNFNNEDSLLIVAGAISEDIHDEVVSLIEANPKIIYMGWQNRDNLIQLMCACDIYIQPGNQSASLQNALCCGCPIVIPPHDSYMPFFDNNGYIIEDLCNMIQIFESISVHRRDIPRMEKNSYIIAKKYLDYSMLAKRIYKN